MGSRGKTKPKEEIGEHNRLAWAFGTMDVEQVLLEEKRTRIGQMIVAVSASPPTRDAVRGIICQYLEDDNVRLVDHAFQPLQ